MKNLNFIIPAILSCMLAASCDNDELILLDKALKESGKYEAIMLDSLLRLKASDTWESNLELADAYSHFQLDSSLKYSIHLRDFYNGDPDRRVIGESRIVKTMDYMGNDYGAITTFYALDTLGADMSGPAGKSYFSVGYRIHQLPSPYSENRQEFKRMCAERLMLLDTNYIESVAVMHHRNMEEGRYEEDIAMINAFLSKGTHTRNAKDRSSHYIAQDYLKLGDEKNYVHFLTKSVMLDIEMSIKNYNALYELGVYCLEHGDMERASRYIGKSLSDAEFSNHSSYIRRNSKSEVLVNDLTDKSSRTKRVAMTIILVLLAVFSFILAYSLRKQTRISLKLKEANEKVSELSMIKESFLAKYMELSADYINKVDEDRSMLRLTAKEQGMDQMMKMLRSSRYSDREFIAFIRNFDMTFLGLYPDFVDKLNKLMQPEYQLVMTDPDALSTEVRIMALIRLGIDERPRIAKILNTSVGTVYTYHSVLQKHSLYPNGGFDEKVKEI